MTGQEKNVFGCMGVIAAIAFVWLSAAVIGGIYEQAAHPERAEQRRQVELAEAQRQATVAQAEEAAIASRRAERERRDDEQRQRENRCIRQMDYETCRRIYHPTPAETAAEQAVVERAARIAEAYRDQ
jgi:flagellar biosynthesis/type III secretory pathway M-ring protein FliF/YscJ